MTAIPAFRWAWPRLPPPAALQDIVAFFGDGGSNRLLIGIASYRHQALIEINRYVGYRRYGFDRPGNTFDAF